MRCREVRYTLDMSDSGGVEGRADGENPQETQHTLTIAVGASGGEAAGRQLPAAVGRYRILRLLGEGGMGAVYEAEQEQPRRKVALKLIKTAWASPELLRRFEQESLALGRLHHPGIAQIYEAGSADTGLGFQPFFAMELIQGKPLCEYANAQHLNTRERLMLMIQVCDAVQHAHQRGIIHRDLKPGNILVDENGQPKILDFGLARVTDSDAQATRQTDMGQLLGTLAYMSPEQVLADPLAVDTRSDVYALGVILYELLAGKLPYTLTRYLHETVQIIRQQDPAPLSSVSRVYRGDIETIVTKALEKDKERRYASAADLAADIRRYLEDQPIAATAPSATYQLRKFARRHKALVGGLAAVFVVLAAGVAVSTWQAVRARRAEVQARQEAAKAEAVNQFLQDMLGSADPISGGQPGARGREVTVAQALAQAVQKLDAGAFQNQPLVDAAIRMRIGETLLHMGNPSAAEPQLRRSLELRRKYLPAVHADVAESALALARLYVPLGRDEAVPLIREALATRITLFGPESREVAEAEDNLLASSADRASVLGIAQDALRLNRKFYGKDSTDAAAAQLQLARVNFALGRQEDGEKAAIEAVNTYRKAAGKDDPTLAQQLTGAASLFNQLGRPVPAESYAREALAIYQNIHLGDHLRVLNAQMALANSLRRQSKLAEAETVAQEHLAMAERMFPTGGVARRANAMELVGWVLKDEGKLEQAAVQLRTACDLGRKAWGADSAPFGNCVYSLAQVLRAQNQLAAAEPQYRDALAAFRHAGDDRDVAVVDAAFDFAENLNREGKRDEAERICRELLAANQGKESENNRRILQTELADVLISSGRFAEAEPQAREALQIAEKNFDKADPRTAVVRSLLAEAMAGQKRFSEAEPLLQQSWSTIKDNKTPGIAGDKAKVLQRVAGMYASWDRAEPKAGKAAEARRWRELLKDTLGLRD